MSAVGIALAALFGLFAAWPAAAHTTLEDSSPQDGAVLTEPPQTVTLDFSDEVLADFIQVAVLDDQENHYESGEPVTQDDLVTQAVAELPDGAYTISYRVGSADGHPITGVVAFTVQGVASEEDEASAPDQQEPEPAQEPSSVASPSPTPDSAQAAEQQADDGTSTSTLVASMAAIALVGVAGVLMMVRRQARHRQTNEPNGQ